MRTPVTLAAAILAAGLVTLPAVAQDAGDRADRRERIREVRQARAAERQPLTAEQREAVWTWEARTVAAALELPETDAAAVRSSWLSVRGELHERTRAMLEERRAGRGERAAGRGEGRGPGDERRRGRGGGRGAAGGPGQGAGAGPGAGAGDGPGAELREAAMADLKQRLGAQLEGERLEKAMTAFGVPTRAWDRATHAVLELEGVDDATRLEAMTAVHGFLAETEAVRAAARDGDREAARTAMQSARETLEANLAGVLDEEQARAVLRGMRPERRGMRGGPGMRGELGERGGRGGGMRPGRRGPGGDHGGI